MSSHRKAFSLIELIAAIAVLGTLLVGIVLAKARHTRQLARADRVHEAVLAADDLLATWWADGPGIPSNSRGPTPTDDTLQWTTRPVEHDALERLGARVIRVSIHDSSDTTTTEALFHVDLVVPATPEDRLSPPQRAQP